MATLDPGSYPNLVEPVRPDVPPARPGTAFPINRFLDSLSSLFDSGVQDLQTNLAAAQLALANDPSNPATLANYQSLLSEYTLYRNAQSNIVKTYKDVDSAIIQNFR